MSTKSSISRMGYNTWSEPKRERKFQRRKQRRIPTTRWISAATPNLWRTSLAGTRRLPRPRPFPPVSPVHIQRWGKKDQLSNFGYPTVLLFVYGSAYIDQTTGKKHAGFGIVTIDRTTHIQQPLPDTFSDQQAELLALTTACKMGEGKTVTIFSDSAYAIGVCLSWCGVWRSRGFHNACGSPIRNRTMVLDLLEAMTLPSALGYCEGCCSHWGERLCEYG
uniref:RNase H type-1 domain-containing protein n=1 Tax=Salmo trutta TaxID=8032 RepID=A0A674CSN8_SALTR